MSPNPKFSVGLVAFTEKILSGNLHFCMVGYVDDCSEKLLKLRFANTKDPNTKQSFAAVLQNRCS